MSRKEPSADLKQIEAILRDWDPIGVIADQMAVGYPPSEYDRYAPGVYALLIRGCNVDDLAKHLARIRAEDMGLRPSPEVDQRVGQRILDWWQSRAEH